MKQNENYFSMLVLLGAILLGTTGTAQYDSFNKIKLSLNTSA